MRRWIGFALLIGLAIGSGVGYAAAQCADNQCLYLPEVRAAGDRCTDILQPSGESDTNWLTEYTIVPGEPLTVCVRATYGAPAGRYYAIAHQRSGDIQTDAVLNDVPTTPVLRLTVPTDQLTPGELVEINVLRGIEPSVIRVGQLYVFVRAP